MTCPICDKPSVQRYRPFCSKRCADVDLGRWFNGVYAVAASGDDESGEDHEEDDGRHSERKII